MKPHTTIIWPGCDLGGTAKTTSLIVHANYLRDRGYKMALFDCDASKLGDISSFAHSFGGKVNTLDLRDVEDCDKLLRQASTAGVPYCLVDLPANSGSEISELLNEVATVKTLNRLGLRLIAVGCISNSPGSTDSVARWMEMMGRDRAQWIITLNRIQYERRVRPIEVAFPEWFKWLKASGQEDVFPTVEVPHIPEHTKKELLRIGKLPSLAAQDSSIDIIARDRIENWVDRINAQLDASGLYVPEEELVAAK